MENTKHDRNCSVCGKHFQTAYPRQNICSFGCRQIAGRERTRNIMRMRRAKKYNKNARTCKPCEICGWNLTTDQHHEGKKVIQLCPNHHALITRGLKTIEQLMAERIPV